MHIPATISSHVPFEVCNLWFRLIAIICPFNVDKMGKTQATMAQTEQMLKTAFKCRNKAGKRNRTTFNIIEGVNVNWNVFAISMRALLFSAPWIKWSLNWRWKLHNKELPNEQNCVSVSHGESTDWGAIEMQKCLLFICLWFFFIHITISKLDCSFWPGNMELCVKAV